MAEEKTKYSAGRLLRCLVPYYKPYLHILVFDLFCAALTTVCDLALPMIVRRITNTAIDDIQALTVRLVLQLGIFYMLLKIISVFATYYTNSTGHIMGTRMETDMRRDLFHHLQRLPFSYYDDAKVGQLMARMTSDLFEITEFAHHGPEEFFMAGLKISVSFIILSTINLPLTLLIFLFLPLMVWITKIFRVKMNENFRISRHQVGEINAQVEDSLLGVRVVKSFANEPVEEQKFKKGNDKFLHIKRWSYRYMGAFSAGVQAVDGVMYIVIVVAGAFFLTRGKINVGDFSAYLLYVSSLLASIKTIVTFMEQFQKGITGIERFQEIMDTPVRIADAGHAKELTDVRGEIVFRDVSFHYGEKDDGVLEHINLTIRAGENIAIVGPSGSGKTTLCNLIPRFYDTSGGSITIDGTDIRDVTLKSLRRSIGVVQQDVYLFSGTIFENIAYGKCDATEADVIEAAKLAGADAFIRQLPGGYQSAVGERGVKLSGGQKQRISIARVFLKNPPILILDEATSALDNESELLVQQSLEKLAKGRTTLTIAHRLTTIRGADKIIVLTKDGIAEEGNHDELIQKKGVYASLYQLYSR